MLLFLENFLIVLFSSLFVFSKTGSFIVIPCFIIFFSMGLWSGMIHSNIKPFIFIVFVIFTAAFNKNLAFFSPVFIAMNLEAEGNQKHLSLIFKFLPLLCVFFNFDLIFFLFTLIIFFYSGVKENYLLKTLEVTGLKDKLAESKINSEKRERILENEVLKNAEVLILAERNRISGSLHNSIGHTLSAGILQVNALKYISNQEDVKESLNILQNSLENGMTEIRECLHNMH
ncbi:histidine kinase, partial [Treponema denticola]